MLKDDLRKELEPIEVSEDLLARTRYAVAKARTEDVSMEKNKKKSFKRILVPALSLAVCAFIGAVGFFIIWPALQRNLSRPTNYASVTMADESVADATETWCTTSDETTPTTRDTSESQGVTLTPDETTPSATETTPAPTETQAPEPTSVPEETFTFDSEDVFVYEDNEDLLLVLGECRENAGRNASYGDGWEEEGAVSEDSAGEPAATTGASPSMTPSDSKGDYSETNIQVEGVDEADIVKTDGEFIYYITNQVLFVVDVRDESNMEVVATIPGLSEITSDRYYVEFYYDPETKTVSVIGNVYNYYYMYDYSYEEDVAQDDTAATEPYIYQPYEYVFVESYDVSDPSEPVRTRSFSQEGYYVSSRRVDDMIFLVTSKYFYMYGEVTEDMLPRVTNQDGVWEMIPAKDIYIANTINADTFTVVSAINVMDEDSDVLTKAVLGAGNIIYSTQDTLYIAGTIWDTDIYKTFEDFYEDAEDQDTKASADDDVYKTRILAFSIGENLLAPKAMGLVNGTVLNQYSIDEYEGVLRIATTSGSWSGSTSNNIVALEEDLSIISVLRDLAPGETIYSARFNGDVIYLVTFEQMDPFFVIDASDPEDMKVAGELKIPGYSNYLHMISDTLVLAIGNETYMQGGSVRTAGLKIAVFDVSDQENPVMVSKLIYGTSYGYSEVQYNPKALLVDLERGFIGLPLSFDMPAGEFGSEYIDGYVLIGINAGGDLKHLSLFKSYDANISSGISRAIYIGDKLFLLGYTEIACYDTDDYSFVGFVNLFDYVEENIEEIVPTETFNPGFESTGVIT